MLRLRINGSILWGVGPSTNAWIRRGVGLDRAVEVTAAWLAGAGDNYGQRALVVPQKGDLRHSTPAIARVQADVSFGFLAEYIAGLGAGGHRLDGLCQIYTKHTGR